MYGLMHSYAQPGCKDNTSLSMEETSTSHLSTRLWNNVFVQFSFLTNSLFIGLPIFWYWACLIHWASNLLILSVPDSLDFQSFDIERAWFIGLPIFWYWACLIHWASNLLILSVPDSLDFQSFDIERAWFIGLPIFWYWACLIHWTSNLLILSMPDSLGFQSFDIERRLMKVIQEIRRVY
jgi:hypothetical protein